ncbi:MAG: AAA family ATPase [Candidatus Latescibacterota bacterium]
MDSSTRNQALSRGELTTPGLFPHLEELARAPFVFRMEFGLDPLPEESGLILVRGARQYGKSTWLEQQVRETVQQAGPGSAYLLNGDEVADAGALAEAIRAVRPLFSPRARVRRLFIDEITAVRDWQRALKRLLDAGELRDVLVITTGSQAADLRRGAERLPGRKGRLSRTSFLFVPVSFAEYSRVCGAHLGSDLLPAYLLSGGSPVAGAELAAGGRLPEFVIEMTRDWVYGEFAAAGRQRSSLLGVMECLHRFAGAPSGQARLAREAGLANNTVAAGYLEQLMDLLCVATAFPWDESRRRANRRRPAKLHFVNLLVAVAWHPARIRSVQEYRALPEQDQARLLEWLVAQEIWRCAAVRGEETPEVMHFWQGREHELDFVLPPDRFVEVKRGKASPVEFAWWPRSFPKGQLTVVNAAPFQAERMVGMTMEEFLAADWERRVG